MSDAPKTDRDLIMRWEWFRRAQWQDGCIVVAKALPALKLFADLYAVIGASVALDAGCGLGKTTLALHELGLNIVGCDPSTTAVESAETLADQKDAPVGFFAAPWETISTHSPHRFDAMLALELPTLADWDQLRAVMQTALDVLKPGGFLMFPGAGEHDPEDVEKQKQRAEWQNEPHDAFVWKYKDGATSCTLVRQKRKEEDFIDETLLYVIEDGGDSRIESTLRRRPAYWTFSHWRELALGAGFCHIETRTDDATGESVNVAWKSKEGPDIDTTGRESLYRD